MRLTPPLITTSEVRYTPSGLRQLVLRSLQIPTIENLAVTLDHFDSFDLTSNSLTSLSNFPLLPRLSELLLSSNSITHLSPDLSSKLPSLSNLVLTGNGLKTLADLLPVLECGEVRDLVLVNNPCVTRPHYR